MKFSIYKWYALAVACAVLFVGLLLPALIGVLDLYLITFRDDTSGLIDWTDARGFRAFLFGVLSFLLLIPVWIGMENGDREVRRIAERVGERMGR